MSYEDKQERNLIRDSLEHIEFEPENDQGHHHPYSEEEEEDNKKTL